MASGKGGSRNAKFLQCSRKVPLDNGLSHVPHNFHKENKSLYNHVNLDLNTAFHKNILFGFKYIEFSKNLIILQIKGKDILNSIQNFTKSFYHLQKRDRFRSVTINELLYNNGLCC